MKKLGQREQQIMQVLWAKGALFVKEILLDLPDPKPHYNSVSTMVRNLEAKGYIGYKAYGKTHQYFAILKKEVYQEKSVNDLLGNFFNNSPSDMLTYFAKKEKISESEIEQILKIIKANK